VSPSKEKRAPQQIQEIVRAVLTRDAIKTNISLGPQNEGNRVEEMANGRPVIQTVRKFLLQYWGDVEIANPSPGCRERFEHLCEMKPWLGPRKRMYVKFGLNVDTENPAASRMTIVRFHAAIGSEPIAVIPELD
jgi:hypothetical protein